LCIVDCVICLHSSDVVYFVHAIVGFVSVAMSHLKQLMLSTDNEQVKVTVNQLCDLLSPPAPGMSSPAPGVFHLSVIDLGVHLLRWILYFFMR